MEFSEQFLAGSDWNFSGQQIFSQINLKFKTVALQNVINHFQWQLIQISAASFH